MTLADSIANDAPTVFLSTDEFAESVTYKPYTDLGETTREDRAIVAVVERESMGVTDGVTVSMAPRWVVHVHNNAATGITGAELIVGRDRISFPPRDGETAVAKTITDLITHDPGMLVLECR